MRTQEDLNKNPDVVVFVYLYRATETVVRKENLSVAAC